VGELVGPDVVVAVHGHLGLCFRRTRHALGAVSVELAVITSPQGLGISEAAVDFLVAEPVVKANFERVELIPASSNFLRIFLISSSGVPGATSSAPRGLSGPRATWVPRVLVQLALAQAYFLQCVDAGVRERSRKLYDARRSARREPGIDLAAIAAARRTAASAILPKSRLEKYFPFIQYKDYTSGCSHRAVKPGRRCPRWPVRSRTRRIKDHAVPHHAVPTRI